MSMTDQVKQSASDAELSHRNEYLGDGLYAGIDGDMIVLSCDREDGEHVVYLDHTVFTALLRYADKVGRWVHGWDK
jgi:hypothetical protein